MTLTGRVRYAVAGSAFIPWEIAAIIGQFGKKLRRIFGCVKKSGNQEECK